MSDPSGLFQSATEGGTAADHPPAPPLRVLAGPATGEESNRIRPAFVPLACWRLGDVRFQFDSSFVVPEAREEFQALSRLLRDHAAPGPGAPPTLTVFGHADPTGDDAYNKALSGRRAAAIYAAMTRRPEIWEDLFGNTGTFALPAAGDQWGETAINTMRTSLNRGGQGKSSAAERKSLFLDYMDFLCVDDTLAPFVVDPKTGSLGGQVDAAGKGDYQGCSEFNPILLVSLAEQKKFAQQKDHAERNAVNAPNRRVMVLLFRPGTHVTPDLWPCPRTKEPTTACRKRFFVDAEARRANQAERREFKDKEDTLACRFYHRLVTRSPCERADKPPLVVAIFDTHTEERDAKVQLRVFDGSGTLVRTIAGEAADDRAGFFLFRIDPATLPNPVRLQWRTADGDRHLAGPCDPGALRDALADPDLETAKTLTRDPPPPPDPGSGDIPVDDDVMANLAVLRPDGNGIEEIV